MALLNQGFVRSLNLDDVEDPFLSINNLGGGTIANDLIVFANNENNVCLLYTSPSPRDKRQSRMPSSA